MDNTFWKKNFPWLEQLNLKLTKSKNLTSNQIFLKKKILIL